ncbi:alpha/beta-hydrolase [Trematosphaeria pertusa]|uniref:Alpha/beta-hydrolase n=1 Tax=Trematosphaeria pertusa TaxID=390896 RepID=A0A6A6I652_9PLEO|nr:alpha/beta-hydrolase [Trematosphaeria pertusa]KAF2245422.1 alpha/beta-hydrolase [Trematosphaeria pertusa]
MAAGGFPDHCTTINLPTGLTYTCVHYLKPSKSSKRTILFLHGFPSSSYDWHHQIKHFADKGYGVIAPDLLGYGGTTSPTSLEPYKLKNMSDDIMAILKHCGVDVDGGKKVHVVGHDFGAIFMSTLIAYYPQIALTCAFLAVPYTPPGRKLDLDAMKVLTERELGFEFFGYRRFLMRDDSWKLMDEHKESFFTLIYGPEEGMIKHFLPAGELEAWLKADRKVPLLDWVTPEYKETRDRIFSKEGAYRGPTDWYRARFREFLGIDEEMEDIGPNPKLPCPTMFMQSADSKMMAKEWTERTKLFADDYEYADVKGGKGHWVQLEAPAEVNRALEDFLERHAS